MASHRQGNQSLYADSTTPANKRTGDRATRGSGPGPCALETMRSSRLAKGLKFVSRLCSRHYVSTESGAAVKITTAVIVLATPCLPTAVADGRAIQKVRHRPSCHQTSATSSGDNQHLRWSFLVFLQCWPCCCCKRHHN